MARVWSRDIFVQCCKRRGVVWMWRFGVEEGQEEGFEGLMKRRRQVDGGV